jgi:hypothetical protein
LIQKADAAQQAFSSDHGPSLHLALPALEALHSAWMNYLKNPKFRDFVGPLKAGIKKIEEYYLIPMLSISQCVSHKLYHSVIYSLTFVSSSIESSNEDEPF